MTRPRQVQGRRGARQGQGPRRRSPHRQEKPRVLIVGEGKETEPNYFDGLRGEEVVRDRFVVDIKRGKGGSALDVVRLAVAERERAFRRDQDYDEVWCVFDVEGAALRNDVQTARQLAVRHSIKLVLSNPCFEVWFIAHFRRSSRSFASAKKTCEELNTTWRQAFQCDYDKNDKAHYQRLSPKTRTAINNARLVRETDHRGGGEVEDCNSCTEVYQLVERLLGSPADKA